MRGRSVHRRAPFLFDQHPPQYLAGRVLGDGVHELDLANLLERGHLVPPDCHQLISVQYDVVAIGPLVWVVQDSLVDVSHDRSLVASVHSGRNRAILLC